MDRASKVFEIDNQISKLQKMMEHEQMQIALLQKKRTEVMNDREILDTEAPRCGDPWSSFERSHLADRLQGFLYKYAKRYGRSTLAIRFKVLEAVLDKVEDQGTLRKMRELVEGRMK